MTRPHARLVGIGSPHGDDQIGWLVADRVGDSLPAEMDIEVKKASSPADLLDWLEGVACLYVCDACHSHDSPIRSADSNLIHEGFYRWNWPAAFEIPLRSSGSHAFGVPQVLQLAQRLGILPAKVVVYGIAGDQFGAFTDTSASLSMKLSDIVAVIAGDLTSGIDRMMRESAHHA